MLFLNVKLTQSAYVHLCVSTQHASSFTAGLPLGMAVSQMAKLLSPKPLRPLGAIQNAAAEKKKAAWICGYKLDILNLPKLEGNETLEMYGKFGGNETLEMYGS